MEAAKKRTSVAKLVREKISKKKRIIKKKKDVEKIMKELDKLAKENAKYFKGIDSTKIIREMRDEQ